MTSSGVPDKNAAVGETHIKSGAYNFFSSHMGPPFYPLINIAIGIGERCGNRDGMNRILLSFSFSFL
jgi:hypothetical protein